MRAKKEPIINWQDLLENKVESIALTRKCWRCHTTKPLTEKHFRPSPGGSTSINPTGLMNQCRKCYDQKELVGF
jgi:5-methylcytosine-specific restriction endonuclease McrA